MTPTPFVSRIANGLSLGAAAFKVAVLRSRAVLAASWRITDRCNAACLYCGYGAVRAPELEGGAVFRLLDELLRAGVRRIAFTGGEPFLREDFGAVLDYCFARSIPVGVNTNGSLLADYASRLGRLRRLTLSLDGPREINDSLRGPGAFDRVVRAVELARARSVARVNLTAVLTRPGIPGIPALLDLARRLGAPVFFQAATPSRLGSPEPTPLSPGADELAQAVRVLVDAKRSGLPVSNSFAGLEYLAAPDPERRVLRCALGTVVAKISPQGELYRCDSRADLVSWRSPRIHEEGFARAWAAVDPVRCLVRCGCARAVEAGLILSSSPSALKNLLFGRSNKKQTTDGDSLT